MTRPYLTDWRESHLSEWRETDLADRVVVEVDQVASVKSAPAHQPKRIASVSRATAREQAVERAQWLEYERSPRRTVGATLNYIAAVLLILATCAMALVGCSEPPEIEAERDNAAAFQDAIAQAQAERPDLWTPETIERAKTAALIAAAGRK